MPSRRQFIGTGTVLASVAVAGCGDILGDNGSDESRVRVAEYVPDMDERPVAVVGQGIHELADISDFAQIGPEDPIFGTDAADVEYSVNVTIGGDPFTADQTGVAIGSFEFDSFQEEIEESFDDVAEIDELEGFRTLQAGADEEALYYGTDGEVVVFATDQDQYEATIKAVAGSEPLLFDNSDELDSLGGVVGDENLVLFEVEPEAMDIDPTGDAVAGGSSIAVSEEESDYIAAVMFESDSEASDNESSVGDAVVEAQSGLESVETEVDGQTVIARGTVTTTEI